VQARVPVSTEWETAIGRAVVYTLIARLLAYPAPEDLDELRSQLVPIAREIRTGDPAVDGLLDQITAGLDAPLDELRDQHSLLFTHIEPEDYPPYESAYSSSDIFRQTSVMADVAGFYRAHGLVVGGRERERPDHIVTELEFMGFMARKEAHALEHLGPEHVEECRRTQAHFLRDHLGRWGPSFGRRVGALSEFPLFCTAGDLLARWLELDMSALDVEPDDRLDEPVPRLAPDDGGCGIDSDRAVGVPVELGPTRAP